MRTRSTSAARPNAQKLPLEAEHVRRNGWWPDRQEQGLLLRVVRGLQANEQHLTTFFNVPDEALRRGDFSRAHATTPARSRLSTTRSRADANGAGRAPFENNHDSVQHDQSDRAEGACNSTRCRTPSGQVWAALPKTTSATKTRSTNRDNYDVKINWNRTVANQIWGKFSLHECRSSMT